MGHTNITGAAVFSGDAGRVVTPENVVVASLRPGNQNRSDFWQFSAPDVLTAYTDWQKAKADIAFYEQQLTQTVELAKVRAESQQNVVDRLKKLVQAGTDTPRDLASEETKFLEVQIQGRRETYEAESSVRVAKQAEAVLARQVQQAGLEPELLQSATSDMDIVLADVPEGAVSAVKIGDGCRADFFGLPGHTFTGKVNRIAPVLSVQRRSLRVLFVIQDPDDLLRPGMFADIGLGTDDRQALLIPAEAVIHVGRSDYVLVAEVSEHNDRVAEVRIGELQGNQVEVLAGIESGNVIIGEGAILLKPSIVRSLRSPAGPEGLPPIASDAVRTSGAEVAR